MRIKYEVYCPADSGEYVDGDQVDLNEMSNEELITRLVNEIESKDVVNASSQVRVNVWRDEEENPFLSHVWDHS